MQLLKFEKANCGRVDLKRSELKQIICSLSTLADTIDC